MNLSAVVLAGGKSSRMGRDKARLEIGGQPSLARQIQLVKEIGAGEVFISGRAGENYEEFGCPVLSDRFRDAGPLAGIERALATASLSRLLVVAVDMPNLTPDIFHQLIERGGETMGVISRVDGQIEPLAAIYPKAAWNLAVSLLGNGIYATKTFARRCVRDGLAVFCDFDAPAARHFASWNRPADALSGVV
jgi:molybdopterin-guanine dinucleotide biosynthesis protein A